MQKIKINNFLGIVEAEVCLDGLTVLIGPQATGKSIIARLFYFFNEYFSGFDDLSLLRNEHKKTYDARKKSDFYKIFPQYSWRKNQFEIEYQKGGYSISLRSAADSEQLELTSSKSVADYFRGIKSSYREFIENVSGVERHSPTRALRDFRRYRSETYGADFESPLFVPAARSFYATLRQEVFSILSLDEKIDRIIMQFGDFYENAKLGFRSLPSNQAKIQVRFPSSSIERRYFQDIVKGQYLRVDDRDWIEMERGRIELNKASSGQQEAVPLLFAIGRFPSEGRTLIIEEPEAHLFPESQIRVLDFIVRQAVNRKTDILFTTHSPYLLSALNNYIVRGQNRHERGIAADKVKAYALSGGKCASIVDSETSLISADYIDSVSEKIAEEFYAALEAPTQAEAIDEAES